MGADLECLTLSRHVRTKIEQEKGRMGVNLFFC